MYEFTFPLPSHPALYPVDLPALLKSLHLLPLHRLSTLSTHTIRCTTGLPLDPSTPLQSHGTSLTLRLHPTNALKGGKGGFGANLRSMGGKMNRSGTGNNVDACRTLNGRRVRTIQDAQRMADHVAREAARNEEKEKKRGEKIEKGLQAGRRLEGKAESKRKFDDTQYWDDLEEESHNTKKAVMAALNNETPSESEGEESVNSERSSQTPSDTAEESSSSKEAQPKKGPEKKKVKIEVQPEDSRKELEQAIQKQSAQSKPSAFAHWDESDESD